MDQKSNTFLETEPIGALMRRYAVPCIISLLVAALYNIVDQIFIANASYLGSYGNAANTVVFPLTVVALAIAVMIGDGCCAFVSISLGANRKEDAHRSIGSAVLLCVAVSIVVTALYLVFQEKILTLFGGRVNQETFVCAKEYFFWITLGIPFYMFGQAMNPIIRSDGSPRFAMAVTLAGAVVNMILDPVFIFGCRWGMMGAAVATVLGQILTAALSIWYLRWGMKAVKLERGSFRFSLRLAKVYLPLGLCSFLSQISLVLCMAAGLFTRLLLAEAAVGAAALLIVELLPRQLIGIFGAANESVHYTQFAVRCFRIYLCMMILATVNKATFIYLQSLGKALVSTLLSMVREVVFGVGFALVLPLFFGLDGVLYSMPVSDVLTFVISGIVIARTYKTLREEPGKEKIQ